MMIQMTKMLLKRSTALERSVKILEGLNMFEGTNLTIIFDVNQDKKMLVGIKRSPYLSMFHLLVHTGRDIKRR